MSEPTTVPTEPADTLEMPRPTVAPLILALGIGLLGAGVVMSTLLVVVGLVIFVVGLGVWISNLLPGRGHVHEPRSAHKPALLTPTPASVEQLRQGMPGYRMRLPLEVHPVSAGVKGGILGGLLMPVPALLWGLYSGHGIWYPINLLAGMISPGVGGMDVADLEKFHLSFLLAGIVIHVITCVVIGLLYGVLMPTLPYLPRELAWGALLMPIFWTAVTFPLMEMVNPILEKGVSWPWFIVSQFAFGVVAGPVAVRVGRTRGPLISGLIGGAAGGVLMPIPAFFWGMASGRGIWYPANLLAGMIMPDMANLPAAELSEFRFDWLVAALVVHAVMCGVFGIVYALLLPKLPRIPAPLSWGGMLMPLLWTGASYSLMGVVNPLLQKRVDWPWFIVSQFVFGITAAIVVVRTETIPTPPAGTGPDTKALTS